MDSLELIDGLAVVDILYFRHFFLMLMMMVSNVIAPRRADYAREVTKRAPINRETETIVYFFFHNLIELL